MIAQMLGSALNVLLAGLAFGAGLPAVFALGVRWWSVATASPGAAAGTPPTDTPRPLDARPAVTSTTTGAPAATPADAAASGSGVRHPVALVGALACFAVVAAAVVLGVLWITQKSLSHYLGITVFG